MQKLLLYTFSLELACSPQSTNRTLIWTGRTLENGGIVLISINNSLECLHTHYQGLTNDTNFVHFNPAGRFFAKYNATFFSGMYLFAPCTATFTYFSYRESVYLFQKLTKIYNCTCRLTRYPSTFYSVHTERNTLEVRGTITILFSVFAEKRGRGEGGGGDLAARNAWRIRWLKLEEGIAEGWRRRGSGGGVEEEWEGGVGGGVRWDWLWNGFLIRLYTIRHRHPPHTVLRSTDCFLNCYSVWYTILQYMYCTLNSTKNIAALHTMANLKMSG